MFPAEGQPVECSYLKRDLRHRPWALRPAGARLESTPHRRVPVMARPLPSPAPGSSPQCLTAREPNRPACDSA